jgi:uncharacterized protein YbjT (DUF2867 family)
VRDPAKVDTVAIPCDTVRFDFGDPSTFAAALRGIRGLFLMRPNPVLKVKSTLNRFLDTAAQLGVRHCVFLSVAGAEHNSMVPHHAVERHLMASSLRWTMLRAGFFAQNLTGPYLADIHAGTLVLPAGHAKVGYVDTRDLGEFAAVALQSPDTYGNQGYHLTGPDSLTFDEVAALLTQELGRPVKYEAASLWRYWRHCRKRGIGRIPTLAYSIIHGTLRGGSGAATDPTLARLLGRSTRSMREFIEDHRSILQ